MVAKHLGRALGPIVVHRADRNGEAWQIHAWKLDMFLEVGGDVQSELPEGEGLIAR